MSRTPKTIRKTLLRHDPATPLPWRAYDRGIGWEIVHDEHDNPINCHFRETFSEADARLIVRSVNAMPKALEALRKAKIKMDARGWGCSIDPEAIEAFNAVLSAIAAAESEDGLGVR